MQIMFYLAIMENHWQLSRQRGLKDAKVGQQQAKLYADCIENQYGQRPVIFLSNGYENYIWDDYNGYSERRIYGFYKKSELQLMIDRRNNEKSLNKIVVKDEISNRYYQKEAIQMFVKHLKKDRERCCLFVLQVQVKQERQFP